MITLDATVLSDVILGTDLTWETVPERVLRYDCFLGDVRFEVGETDFSTHWGWVPVLDFALSMSSLLADLAPDDSRLFEFTESEAFIRLHRVGQIVQVSASYVRPTADVGFRELQAAVDTFTHQLAGRLAQEHPALLRNSEFANAIRRARVA